MILLTTERLLLRSAISTDFNTLHSHVFSDPNVAKLLFDGGTFTESQSREFFESRFNFDGREPYGFCVMVERETTHVVGFAGLINARHLSTDDYEFGYVLAHRYWGKGYATEIARGQMDWAFNELGLKQLFALVDPENLGSIKVLEKLALASEPALVVEGKVNRLVFKATPPSKET